MKKYYKSIGIAKGLGIILVVYIHCLPNIDAEYPNFNNNDVISTLYSMSNLFIMPLFFFLSGLVASKVLNYNWKEAVTYIKGRFFKLMIPYFAVSLLATLAKYVMNAYALRSLELKSSIMATFINPWNGPIKLLWFVYALFLISVIVVMLRKIDLRIMLTVSTILSILPLYIGDYFTAASITRYLVFYNLGLLTSRYYEGFEKMKYKKTYFFVNLMILFALSFVYTPTIFRRAFLFGTSIIGIMMTLNLACVLENTKLGDILDWLGNRTLYIYLFSWFFQTFFRILLFQILDWNYYVVLLFMFTGGFLPLFIPVSKDRIWNSLKKLKK